jgi:hypothetical protein
VWKLAENDCEGTRARQDPRWRRVATLAVATAVASVQAQRNAEQALAEAQQALDAGLVMEGEREGQQMTNEEKAAAEATLAEKRAQLSAAIGNDGSMSPEDLEMWRSQYVALAADGNLEFGDLARASSLPTLLRLLGVPSLRVRAVRVLHTISASPLRSEIRELEEQSIPLAQALGSLLASADDSAVRCGAMGVATVARHDAVRASLFHAGNLQKVALLAGSTKTSRGRADVAAPASTSAPTAAAGKIPVLVKASEPGVSGRKGRQSPRHEASVRYVEQQGTERDSSRAQLIAGKGGLADWQREERVEAEAQQACREATLRLQAARSRARTQLGVAKKAERKLDERLKEMEAALKEADRQEIVAYEARVEADKELAEAQAAEEDSERKVEEAELILEKAIQEEAAAADVAAAAVQTAQEMADAKVAAEADETTAIKEEEEAEAALKAQQTAEEELAEAQRIVDAGLVTEGEREGQKMKKEEKAAAGATLAEKQAQLSAAPSSKIDAPAEESDLDEKQAALEAAENKKDRKELELQVAEKEVRVA